MKRFYVALIALFALVLMFPKISFAADLPSFRSLDPENIKLVRAIPSQIYDYTCYNYKLTPNTANNFIEKFNAQLINSSLFRVSLAGQFQHDYREYGGKIETHNEFYFKYTGSKKISSEIWGEDHKKHDVKICHNLNSDFVLILVSNGLSFEDEDTLIVQEVQPQPAPVETTPIQTTPVSVNQNDGADVPDFGQVGATYDHNQHNGDGSITYIFKASGLSESRADEYVNQYISMLTGSNFVQTGYDKQKFSERVSKIRQSETWTFDYNGSKSISGLSDGKALHLKRVRNLQTGDTSFEIKVAKDLVFAGNYEKPAPPPPGKTTCSACGGDGRCRSCGGSGYIRIRSDYDQPCGVCRTSGRCSDCDGRGYK